MERILVTMDSITVRDSNDNTYVVPYNEATGRFELVFDCDAIITHYMMFGEWIAFRYWANVVECDMLSPAIELHPLECGGSIVPNVEHVYKEGKWVPSTSAELKRKL